LTTLSTNIGAAVTEGSFAASAATIGGALVAAVSAWLIGNKVGNELGKALFPDDAELYENFHLFGQGGFFDQMSGDLDSTMADISGAFELWGEDIAAAIAPAFTDMNNSVDQFFKNIDDNGGVLESFNQSLDSMAASGSDSCVQLGTAMIGVNSAFDSFFLSVENLKTGATTAFNGMVTDINATFDQFFLSVEMVKTNTVNAATLMVQDLRTKFTEILTYIQTVFTTAWQGAWNGITSYVSNAFNNVKSTVRSVLAAIVNAVNTLIGGINTVSGVVGIPAIPLIPVPQFAQGVTVTSPTIAMVGEAGPETIVPHGNTPRTRALLQEAAEGVYGSKAEASGGNTYNITFSPVIQGGGDADEITDTLMRKFKAWYDQMKRDEMREAYAGA